MEQDFEPTTTNTSHMSILIPKRPKVKVGQILYRRDYAALWNSRYGLHCVVVTKVGRKYFTVQRPKGRAAESRHDLSDWQHCPIDSAFSMVLHASVQEWRDYFEHYTLARRIQRSMEWSRHRFSLASLRLAAEVLGLND